MYNFYFNLHINGSYNGFVYFKFPNYSVFNALILSGRLSFKKITKITITSKTAILILTIIKIVLSSTSSNTPPPPLPNKFLHFSNLDYLNIQRF